MEESVSLESSVPKQSGILGGLNGPNKADSSEGSASSDLPLYVSGIAESLYSGVGMLVVVPIVAVAAAVVMCIVMLRSGKVDEAPIVSAVIIAVVSGVGATVATVLIYMISNMFV